MIDSSENRTLIHSVHLVTHPGLRAGSPAQTPPTTTYDSCPAGLTNLLSPDWGRRALTPPGEVASLREERDDSVDVDQVGDGPRRTERRIPEPVVRTGVRSDVRIGDLKIA